MDDDDNNEYLWLETVLKSSKLNHNIDAIFRVVHWCLVSKAGLKFVGTGDDFKIESDFPPTELIPTTETKHRRNVFKYRGTGLRAIEKYVLSLETMTDNENVLSISLTRINDGENVSTDLKIDDIVLDLDDPNYKDIFTDLDSFLYQVLDMIIHPMFPFSLVSNDAHSKPIAPPSKPLKDPFKPNFDPPTPENLTTPIGSKKISIKEGPYCIRVDKSNTGSNKSKKSNKDSTSNK